MHSIRRLVTSIMIDTFVDFLSVYTLTLLLVTFRLWFVTSSCSYDSWQLELIVAIAAHVCIEVAVAASDASDHSTVVLKEFGPKRVLCDCSCCRAMTKRQSMLIFFKKLTEQEPDSLHPDSLHSFQNARQVDLWLLPTVPHLQCNTCTSKILGI